MFRSDHLFLKYAKKNIQKTQRKKRRTTISRLLSDPNHARDMTMVCTSIQLSVTKDLHRPGLAVSSSLSISSEVYSADVTIAFPSSSVTNHLS